MKAYHIISQINESRKDYLYVPEKSPLVAYYQKDRYGVKMDYSLLNDRNYLNNADLFVNGKIPGIIPGIKDSSKKFDIDETAVLQIDRNKTFSLMNGHSVSTTEDLIKVLSEEKKPFHF